MIWSHEECMSRDNLTDKQLQNLKTSVTHCYNNVDSYRRKMDQRNISPNDIVTLADLKKLPFTEKSDLRDNYPFGLFAVPLKKIVRLHASSGTTGKPIVVGYTKNDIEIWGEVVARTLSAAGIGSHDFIQNAYGYGLFTGGLGIHYGAEKVQASVIPISGGNTQKQIELMQDFGTTAIACTPSYALFLAETIKEYPELRSKLNLKRGIFGAEPWTEEMRQEIQNLLDIDAYDIYGLSEVIGPGVAYECENKNGLHICEDHFIPEIIDPITGEVKKPGEEGELVFTTITKEGFPMIRYRTRDITTLNYEKCECGRTHVRMAKCTGRSDDMLIIRGVNLFPSQIESALLEYDQTSSYFNLHVTRTNQLDQLKLIVEKSSKSKALNDDQLRVNVKNFIKQKIGLSMQIEIVDEKTLERSTGKSKRVFDKRKH